MKEGMLICVLQLKFSIAFLLKSPYNVGIKYL